MAMVLRLDPALDRQLGHAAIDDGSSKSALIRLALMQMLAAREQENSKADAA